eukprot:TRINITY_DN2429_c0_g1_i1.p1 TRINITY_DN2429_c0_g1~~TRINITY_DN2429_c0_g1_i1.p1  ORF type:complete len:550 (-),score=194.19 TRINITY_DN2429_c0_g1_i1:144-1793(-)
MDGLSLLEKKEMMESSFLVPNCVETLYSKALVGRFGHVFYRGIAWKVFLKLFDASKPFEEWGRLLSLKRKRYRDFKKRYLVDPRSPGEDTDDDEEEAEVDLEVENPLSLEESSSWTQYFQTEQLQDEIKQDLERLHPGDDFFGREDVQEMMLRVLTVWCRHNPSLSYRQGMHELLSFLLFACHSETWVEDESYKFDEESDKNLRSLRLLTLKSDIEADAYLMFEQLMKRVTMWYAVPNANSTEHSMLAKSSSHIFNVLLKDADPFLFKQLKRLEIEPQIFLIRWLRLLFGREFHRDDVLVIWDAILADSSESDMLVVEYIATAMLIFIRRSLLAAESDVGQAIKRLMKFPPVENVSIFVEMAREGRRGGKMLKWSEDRASGLQPGMRPGGPGVGHHPPGMPVRSSQHPQPIHHSASVSSSSSAPVAANGKSGSSKRRTVEHELREKLELLQKAYDKLSENVTKEAGRLESIVDVLQINLIARRPMSVDGHASKRKEETEETADTTEPTEEEVKVEVGVKEEEYDEEAVLIALAELKQVRDRFLYGMVED